MWDFFSLTVKCGLMNGYLSPDKSLTRPLSMIVTLGVHVGGMSAVSVASETYIVRNRYFFVCEMQSSSSISSKEFVVVVVVNCY